MNSATIKKATQIVHWPTGPVPACDDHARQIVALGQFMGAHTPCTVCDEDIDCTNCVNEAKDD